MGTIGRELLKDRFLTQADVARLAGVSKQVVSRWVSGAKRPAPEHREILERELGIPVEAWLKPNERAEQARELPEIVTEYMRRLQTRAADLLASISRKAL